MDNQNKDSFNEVKNRLDEIVEAVDSEDISLDDALALYEEAVKLGMQATNILETDIDPVEIEEEISALESTEESETIPEEAKAPEDAATNQMEAQAEIDE